MTAQYEQKLKCKTTQQVEFHAKQKPQPPLPLALHQPQTLVSRVPQRYAPAVIPASHNNTNQANKASPTTNNDRYNITSNTINNGHSYTQPTAAAGPSSLNPTLCTTTAAGSTSTAVTPQLATSAVACAAPPLRASSVEDIGC